jgi:hypothetical protein
MIRRGDKWLEIDHGGEYWLYVMPNNVYITNKSIGHSSSSTTSK